MRKEMEVLYVEGVAIHDGPESCAVACEGEREALTGGVWAGLLSREISIQIRVPTLSKRVEGHVADGATREPSRGPCAVGEPRHARRFSCARTGRPDDRPW